MNEKIVNSQAELDAIPLDYNGGIIIEFGTPYNRAVVNKKYKLPVAAYGDGPGLVCSGGEASAPQAKKPKPNRRKPHRLVVYVDDPLFRRIQSAASSRGYVTMQGFLESLLYKLEEEKENPHEV